MAIGPDPRARALVVHDMQVHYHLLPHVVVPPEYQPGCSLTTRAYSLNVTWREPKKARAPSYATWYMERNLDISVWIFLQEGRQSPPAILSIDVYAETGATAETLSGK